MLGNWTRILLFSYEKPLAFIKSLNLHTFRNTVHRIRKIKKFEWTIHIGSTYRLYGTRSMLLWHPILKLTQGQASFNKGFLVIFREIKVHFHMEGHTQTKAVFCVDCGKRFSSGQAGGITYHRYDSTFFYGKYSFPSTAIFLILILFLIRFDSDSIGYEDTDQKG